MDFIAVLIYILIMADEMFRVNIRKIVKFEDTLMRVSNTAIPRATAETLNEAASVTMRLSKNRINRQFTLRNKWTEGSIKTIKTRERSIPRQKAVVGSLQDYMADQEYGSVKRKEGVEGVPIPTGYSSGEGKTPTPRKRLPRGAHKLRKIRLSTGRFSAKTKRQETLLRIRDAVKTGRRYVFLDTGRTKGIFKVVRGTKKKPEKANIQMVYSLKHPVVRIPREPWLHPSVKLVEPHISDIYVKALRGEVRKLNRK